MSAPAFDSPAHRSSRPARLWLWLRLLGILLLGGALIWVVAQPRHEETVRSIRDLGGSVNESDYLPDWLPQFLVPYVRLAPEVDVVLGEDLGEDQLDAILRLLPRFRRLRNLKVVSRSLQDEDLRFLSRQSGLESLSVVGYQLRGTFVSGLRGHRSLQMLRLDGAGLDESLIPGLRTLPRDLEGISLSGRGVTDETVRAISHLKSLRSLSLAETNVTGVAFRELQGLSLIWELNLRDSPVTDEGMRELKNFPQLSYLTLDGTRVSDEGLPVVRQLPELRSLSLARTAITSQGFEGVSNPLLTRLDLSRTQVTDDSLQAVVSLQNLRFLYISSTKLTDACFDQLLQIPRLSLLDVGGTAITQEKVREIRKLRPTLEISLESP